MRVKYAWDTRELKETFLGRGATNPEINLDLAPNPCYLDLDLDLYATFGFGFGLVCYVWIWIWICSPSLGICLDLTV
jgi:hypothetical protein